MKNQTNSTAHSRQNHLQPHSLISSPSLPPYIHPLFPLLKYIHLPLLCIFMIYNKHKKEKIISFLPFSLLSHRHILP